jgi:hypothetical protein
MNEKRSNQENQHTDSELDQSVEASSRQAEPEKPTDEDTFSADAKLEARSEDHDQSLNPYLDAEEKVDDEEVDTEEMNISEEKDQPLTLDSEADTLDDDVTEGSEQQQEAEPAQENSEPVERIESSDLEETTEPKEESSLLEEESNEAEHSSEDVKVTDTEKKQTREKRRQTQQREKKPSEKKPRLRLIPIWLRILISIVLIGGCLILGLMFGYGVIGGGNPAEALKPDTWYHILDIIRGN